MNDSSPHSINESVSYSISGAELARLHRLVEQLETMREELRKVADGVEIVHEEDIGMWAVGVLALAKAPQP